MILLIMKLVLELHPVVFSINDINNSNILSYDIDYKRTLLTNPCNYEDKKPLLTEVTANEKYVKTTGNSTINGILKVETTFPTGMYITNSLLSNNFTVGINIGKGPAEANMISLSYQEPAIGVLGFRNLEPIITWSTDYIDLRRSTGIHGNLTVTGTITSANSTTITHLAPIEAGEEISDFKVGKPVFMSGHVYKRENGVWISSSSTDSTD